MTLLPKAIYTFNAISVDEILHRLEQKLFIFSFLGLHPWHMEVPGLGVESHLQLLAYTTATVMPDLSHI